MSLCLVPSLPSDSFSLFSFSCRRLSCPKTANARWNDPTDRPPKPAKATAPRFGIASGRKPIDRVRETVLARGLFGTATAGRKAIVLVKAIGHVKVIGLVKVIVHAKGSSAMAIGRVRAIGHVRANVRARVSSVMATAGRKGSGNANWANASAPNEPK